jgi:DNA ligase (NAD+)
MFSPDETRNLQKLTGVLLEKANKQSVNKKDVSDIRNVLRFHEYRYYIMNDPLISDFEYDSLYKELEKVEAAHPALVTADSPTQRVAKGLTKDFPTVQHLVPMLSLENSYDALNIVWNLSSMVPAFPLSTRMIYWSEEPQEEMG